MFYCHLVSFPGPGNIPDISPALNINMMDDSGKDACWQGGIINSKEGVCGFWFRMEEQADRQMNIFDTRVPSPTENTQNVTLHNP